MECPSDNEMKIIKDAEVQGPRTLVYYAFSESPLDSWLSLRAVYDCIYDELLNVLGDP